MTAKQDVPSAGLETYWLEKTAKEYRERGFDVSLGTRLKFLPGFRPDIVATKGDDNRVIEVKRRMTLQKDAAIAELARVVESEPGWQLDLVLIPEAHQLAAPDDSQPLGISEALHRLSHAQHLREAGNLESSLLIAWSACEAVIRTLLQEETGRRAEVPPSSLLIDSATMHGVISHDDGDYLKQLLPLRNAVAHGMSHADVQDTAVLGLFEFVHHVVDEAANDDTASS
ncbi:hypothetical protein [Candidatus Poriferisodalis sp.]|uniref:hypothetical protein n=1 Tax=Candidatus Poriferisodalis sp. TaxID=3101277 RepID=UPI003B022366